VLCEADMSCPRCGSLILCLARSTTRASTTAEFVFRTKSSRTTIASPLNGGSGLTGKSGRKTANACGANASAMTIKTSARLMLAEQYFDRSLGTLVQWRCPAFVMTHCVDLFDSSCLKTGHDYGVQKDCRKHDLIAATPPSLSDRIECVVR
jgi:hypothetical protein